MASHGTVAELGSGAFRHLEVPELDLAQNERCGAGTEYRRVPLTLTIGHSRSYLQRPLIIINSDAS